MGNQDKFTEIRKRIKEAADKAMNRAFRNALSKLMAKQMRIRTRVGKGVKEFEGPTYSLSSVKRTAKYEKLRTRWKKSGDLASSTSPRKHNLTKSGELLDSIYGKATTDGFSINVRDERTDGKRNSKIIDGQRKLGREFLNLSKAEMRQMRRAIRKKITQQIKSEFH